MSTPVDPFLANFQRTRSDEAFRELVSRYSGLVHSTATRLLDGDRSAADDVSQQVFLRLLKKASLLSPRICMAGWLYRQTCRLAADHRRSTSRRKAREQFAQMTMNEQESKVFVEGVDEALASLREEDRNVILLRYFEEQSHRAVGDSLGISEDAARKKCARAVEALRSFFGRRGQAFSVATIGVLLTGLDSKPLSAATLRTMFPESISLAPKTSPVLSLMAGLILGGCSAGGYLFLSQESTPEIAASPTRISERGMEPDLSRVSKQGGFQSVETVIEQVRVLMRRPQNAMRLMELEALFDSLAVDQREAFFVAAKEVLTIAEKRFCYGGFLKHWMAEAPEEAMNLCLTEEIETQLEDLSTHLVQNLFADWARKDHALSSEWLRRNWEHPALAASGFPHSLKVAMSHDLVQKILNERGVAAAFEAAKTFGDSEDFMLVSEAITGTTWNQVNGNQGVEIYRCLFSLPNSKKRDQLLEKFIDNWKQSSFRSAESLMNALEELEPSERLPLELRLLGEFQRKTREKTLANGSIRIETIGEEPTEEERALRREEREVAFRESARQAGLDRDAANLMIARYYLENEREDASAILKMMQPSTDLDRDILEAVRRQPMLSLRGSAVQELKAFRYVQHLTSAEEKEKVSRALFRRIIVKNPHDARALLESPDFSPEILKTLNEVALNSSL